MGIPKEIVEWLVWVSLYQHKDLELLLLKGHLIMEVLVTTVISQSEEKSSFHRKVQLLSKQKELQSTAYYLFELNKIRNQFAHEFTFDIENSGFHEWAKNVTSEFPFHKYSKKTKRTLVVHAFSALARNMYNYYLESKA